MPDTEDEADEAAAPADREAAERVLAVTPGLRERVDRGQHW
ncbi:MAG TPA: hypothetical protein VMC03_10860 [Streptosporangiaceae bacterium]|nr:hypothetical protein [Streptosporangiaceae bacterium]